MRLKTTRTWTTKHGRRRVIRLYNSWKNLLARTRGTGKAGNGENYWAGKEVEWASFEAFRQWAVDWGYSKKYCSLDRINPEGGYTERNCRWMTVAENTSWENACRRAASEEPVPF